MKLNETKLYKITTLLLALVIFSALAQTLYVNRQQQKLASQLPVIADKTDHKKMLIAGYQLKQSVSKSVFSEPILNIKIAGLSAAADGPEQGDVHEACGNYEWQLLHPAEAAQEINEYFSEIGDLGWTAEDAKHDALVWMGALHCEL